MLLILENSDLPELTEALPKQKYPLIDLDTDSSAPLLQFKYYQEFGIEADETQLGEPEVTFKVYKLPLITGVSSVTLPGHTEVRRLKYLEDNQFYIDEDYIYISSPPDPLTLQGILSTRIPPNPSRDEFTLNLPSGLTVNQIVMKGMGLEFAQNGSQIIVDTCGVCNCPILGGEAIALSVEWDVSLGEANYTVMQFDVNIPGVIDYVEYMGKTYQKALNTVTSNSFFYYLNKLKLWL